MPIFWSARMRTPSRSWHNCASRTSSFAGSVRFSNGTHFFQGGKSMRFCLIDQAKKEFPLHGLCTVLGVSQIGYFAWKGLPASARQRASGFGMAANLPGKRRRLSVNKSTVFPFVDPGSAPDDLDGTTVLAATHNQADQRTCRRRKNQRLAWINETSSAAPLQRTLEGFFSGAIGRHGFTPRFLPPPPSFQCPVRHAGLHPRRRAACREA